MASAAGPIRAAARRAPSARISPKSFAAGDRRDDRQHRLAIAEAERSAGVAVVKDAAFDAFHGHRQREAERRRIEAELVAKDVGPEHAPRGRRCRDSSPARRGSPGECRRSAGRAARGRPPPKYLMQWLGQPGHSPSPQVAPHEILRIVGARPFEYAVAVIARAQRRIGAKEVDPCGKARRLELPLGQRIVEHAGAIGFGQRPATFRIGDRRVVVAANGDRLQPLRSHDRADPHARRLKAAVGDDARIADQRLAGGADDGGGDAGADLVFEAVDGFRDLPAPQFAGVVEGDAAVLDEDRHRDLAGAAKDEGIDAASLERVAERTFAAGLANSAGKRALGRRGETRQSGIGLAGNDARGEDEEIGRIEGVDPARTLPHQIRGGEQSAAAVEPPEIFVRLLDGGRAVAEIDVQDLPVIAVPGGHGSRPTPRRTRSRCRPEARFRRRRPAFPRSCLSSARAASGGDPPAPGRESRRRRSPARHRNRCG